MNAFFDTSVIVYAYGSPPDYGAEVLDSAIEASTLSPATVDPSTSADAGYSDASTSGVYGSPWAFATAS